MAWLSAIFSLLVAALVAIVRTLSFQDGKNTEKLRNNQEVNEALKDEIDRLNTLPRNDIDRFRLWERRIKEAKDREKRQQ